MLNVGLFFVYLQNRYLQKVEDSNPALHSQRKKKKRFLL